MSAKNLLENLRPKTKKQKLKKIMTLFKCTVCKKDFADKWSLHSHKKIHTNALTYQCSKCPYKCKVKKYLTRHEKCVHTSPTAEKCDICGKMFHFKCNLTDHMRIHTGEKPFKCKDCGKAFNSTYSLGTHILIHSGEKPFKCVFCDYACRDSSTLRKHEERHMGIVKVFQCKLCSKTFKMKSHLNTHNAEVHLEMATPRLQCERCDSKFKTKATLTNHIKAVHEKLLGINCEICGYYLSNKGNLPSHMRKHIDARPYRCTFKGCNKRFKSADGAKRHDVTHRPERQHECGACGRRFARRHRLRGHLLQHRPRARSPRLECAHCARSFYNKSYLSTHIQRKHGAKRQKYECDECGFVTTNKPSIVMHLKYGHDKYHDLECTICHTIYKRHEYLKSHYLRTHKIRYKPVRPIKVKEEKEVDIKQEPLDYDYEQTEPLMDLIDIEKHEIDDDGSLVYSRGVLAEDLARGMHSLLQPPQPSAPHPAAPGPAAPDSAFDEFFIDHVLESVENDDVGHSRIDKEEEEKAKRSIQELLTAARRHKEVAALDRARHEYNRRMEKVTKNCHKAKSIKIKVFKKVNVNNSNLANGISENNKIKHKSVIEKSNSIDEAINNNNEDVNKVDNNSPNLTEDDTIQHTSKDHPVLEELTTNPKYDVKITLNVENVTNDVNSINMDDKNYETYVDDDDMSKTNIENASAEELADVKDKFNDANETVKVATIERSRRNINRRKYVESDNEDIPSDDDQDYTIDGDKGDSIDEGDEKKRSVNKITINSHQCSTCFKLFETHSQLIEHCTVHFDVCSETTLKKCPLCHLVTKNMRSHLKLVHQLKVQIPYNRIHDRAGNENGSRYYYAIDNERIQQMEIIPSVKVLNKHASMEIDRKNRERKNRTLAKTKLVRKGNEWIVEKEPIKLNGDFYIPKFEEKDVDMRLAGDTYLDRMKKLSRIAKKNGKRMLFPCDSCEKICQNMSGLKLHSRRHEKNPRPFKKKVWKHKQNTNANKTEKGIVKNKEYNGEHRKSNPKPIVGRHKCDDSLKKFYENNIKGADIEFWQFLKIFNRMGRENVKDFKDLEERTDFGIHISEKPPEPSPKRKVQRKKTRNKYTRVIRLSKKERERRQMIKETLRSKLVKT